MIAWLVMAGINMTERWDCETCQEAKRKSMNCDGTMEKGNIVPIVSAVPWMILRRCPRAIVEDNLDVMVLWEDYITWRTLKQLPYEGGLFSQPSKYIETIQFLEQLINKIQHDKYFQVSLMPPQP